MVSLPCCGLLSPFVARPFCLALLRSSQEGKSVAHIAAAFGVAARTVRHLLRRCQDQNTLKPAYDQCGRPEASPSPLIEEAVCLRQQHGGWGAGLIRVLLQEKH